MGRIERVTITGDVANLRKQRSGMSKAIGSTGRTIWVPSSGYDPDIFAISGPTDLDHTLTYVPLGLNRVVLNNIGLSYGDDFTFDWNTGTISLVQTPKNGDILEVWYVTDGRLVASSVAPEKDAQPLDYAGAANNIGGSGWAMSSMSIASRRNGAWTSRVVAVDNLLELGIADAYSVETTVAANPTGGGNYYDWYAAWGNALRTAYSGSAGIGNHGVFLETDNSTCTFYLFHNNTTVLSQLVTHVPVAGDTIKVVTDFLAETATAYINGIMVASLDLSAQAWYTADGTLA